MNLLSVDNVLVRFGGVVALNRISLAVERGEFLGILGPNGCGKSTLFNAITGVQRVHGGSVALDGAEITSWPVYRRAMAGLARTYQSVEIFPQMTVADNLRFACEVRSPGCATNDVDGILDLLGLAAHRERPAGQLSYGQQKLVCIGIALAGHPRIILLDEPFAAVNPTLSGIVADKLRELNTQGSTIVLVEHNVPLVVDLASRVVVLAEGSVIFDGRPADVVHDDTVTAAYLGGRPDDR